MSASPKTADPAAGRASATISGRLAAFAVNLQYDAVPADVKAIARMVLTDTLGCALAGAVTDELKHVRGAMLAASGGGGDSLLWGTAERAPLPLAALANGTAAHAREIDDFGGCAHSGAVVIPAALGTAARVGASGRELLTAIVIGYEVARRAMEGAGGYLPLKKRGWHSTSACGVFGAAAAVGRLLGLDEQRMQWALGYAGSNTGGTWAFIPDGAMSKRVHPGFAAQNGVIAAYLGANGASGPTEIFETEWGGFFSTYGGAAATPERALENLGTDYRMRMVGIKPYAACRGVHSGIDATLALRHEHGITAADVARITVRGNPLHLKQLGKQNIATMLDAQFSLPYGIAVALTTGGAMIDQYTPAALRRPAILELAQRIEVVIDAAVEEGTQPFVDAHLRDGRVLSKRVPVASGDRSNPLSPEALRTKFRTAAGETLDAAQLNELEQALSEIETMTNACELAALLAPRAQR
jgi:2-methylcitrate dehydratase PrpD